MALAVGRGEVGKMIWHNSFVDKAQTSYKASPELCLHLVAKLFYEKYS